MVQLGMVAKPPWFRLDGSLGSYVKQRTIIGMGQALYTNIQERARLFNSQTAPQKEPIPYR
jgi:hypothetical protein